MSAGGMPTSDELLEIDSLVLVADEPHDGTPVVEGVSLRIRHGEVLALVGESGSGKTLTMLAVMGLLPPGIRVASGDIRLRGESLLRASAAHRRRLRGSTMTMVFQDPLSALNPLRRVGAQVGEVLRQHEPGARRSDVRRRVVELLASVGIHDPAAKARAYPHQWSGGMRQRAMIAMAVANRPDLVIADEPTTALDVTVQAQVMRVLADARADTDASMILITHDLGLAAGVADQVAVMRGGRIVESGPVLDVYDRPGHPYTRALLSAAQIGHAARGSAPRSAVDIGDRGAEMIEIAPGHLVAGGRADRAVGGTDRAVGGTGGDARA